MLKVLKVLEGKKTYLAAGLTAGIVILHVFGIIGAGVFEAAVGLLTALGLWALRSAVAKVK